jgi:hypothetical protein
MDVVAETNTFLPSHPYLVLSQESLQEQSKGSGMLTEEQAAE